MADMTGKQIVQAFLDDYGLGALGDWAWNLYTTSGAGDINEFVRGQLTVELPQQQAFKTRFPAYQALMDQGQGITVEAYRRYETNIAELARTYGLPTGMFEDRDYVAQMMVSGVSAREFEERAAINREAAYNAPAEVKTALAQMYGVSNVDSALTAYFFDPDKALPMLQREFQSAQIAGAALQQSISVSKQTAERLSLQGVTWDQAQQGFRQVSLGAGLAAAGGDSANQDTMVAAQFGDAAAQTVVERARAGRRSAFQGGGSAVEGQSGVSGLGSTSR